MNTTWLWLTGAFFTACAVAAFNGNTLTKTPAALVLDMLWAVVFSSAWPLVLLVWCGMELRRRWLRLP